jgi:hypothetical protein
VFRKRRSKWDRRGKSKLMDSIFRSRNEAFMSEQVQPEKSDESLDESGPLPIDTKEAIKRLFGSWDEAQVREFLEVTAEFSKIDEDMWK